MWHRQSLSSPQRWHRRSPGLHHCHRSAPRPSTGRQYSQSQGQACDIHRIAGLFPSTGTEPSKPRFQRQRPEPNRMLKSRNIKALSAFRNCIRFNDARLQAVSSRNIYSEQGLEALIRPPSGQVCHSLMVLSYCSPGSAQAHAAWAIFSHRSAALIRLATPPSRRLINSHSPWSSTACKTHC